MCVFAGCAADPPFVFPFYIAGDIIGKIREKPFSISTDGSFDRGAQEQLYPILVRFFDNDVQHVVTVLLEIATTKETSTGKNIFGLLDQALTEHKIPWKNVICFSADNAAVMMGVHNGVAAYVKEKNPEVYVNGCVCHLLHLAAEKGAQQLPTSPVDLLIPIFYYREKSSKRNKAFREVQACCDVKLHAILKHVCTRWLPLEQALDRLLEQWVPLVEFFRSESETSSSSAPKKSGQLKTTAKEVQHQLQKKNTGHAPGLGKVSMTSSKSVFGKACTTSESSSSGTKRKMEGDSHHSSGKKNFKTSFTKPASGKSSTTPASVSKSSTGKGAQLVTKILSPCAVASSTSAYASTSSIGKRASVSDVTKKILPKSTKVGSGKEKTQSARKPTPSSSGSLSSKKTGQLFAGTKHAVSHPSQEVTATSKASAIYDKLTNDESKLYCLFLQHNIPLFTRLNVELQEESPKIHVLLDRLQAFLQSVQTRFVKPKVLITCASSQVCDYTNLGNQREDEDLVIGSKVRELLQSGHFSDDQKKEFFSSVRKYYVSVCSYVETKFPMKDPLLMHARVANLKRRQETPFASVVYFIRRFHFMEGDLDTVELEYASYQSDPAVDKIDAEKADLAWVAVSQLKDPSSGQLCYAHLAKVMILILSISHSNASDERLFSMVRKNKTDFRSSLSTATLSDILTQKATCQSKGQNCYEMKFSDRLLARCKGAATTAAAAASGSQK